MIHPVIKVLSMQNQVLFVTDHPFEPVDEHDRACMVHDKCWDALGLFDKGPQKAERACESGWRARTGYLTLWSYDWDSSFNEKTKVRIH